MSYARTGSVEIDGFLIFVSLVSIASLLFTIVLIREKRWLNAFGIQRKLNELLSPAPRTQTENKSRAPGASAAAAVDAQSLSAIIDRMVEEKLAKRSAPEFSAPPSPLTSTTPLNVAKEFNEKSGTA
jgi:hypothetical protein